MEKDLPSAILVPSTGQPPGGKDQVFDLNRREQMVIVLLVLSLSLGSGLWLRAAVWSAEGPVEIQIEEMASPEELPASAQGDWSLDPRVNVNTASEELLVTLPGIGPVLARRIIAYREEHGHFATLEDLLQVSGIGEKKLAALEDLIRVE